ncbi:hypothetical protein [Salidesulfovibrio brasiliensis]|uniref:hypothetical protein n=1 Tax=Salidesulfovibrio brasiliensis TaxID=221711 RepID=UPI001C4815EA|nr:hypothetical protein [Salidesulfovibrio brasiliensis]
MQSFGHIPERIHEIADLLGLIGHVWAGKPFPNADAFHDIHQTLQRMKDKTLHPTPKENIHARQSKQEQRAEKRIEKNGLLVNPRHVVNNLYPSDRFSQSTHRTGKDQHIAVLESMVPLPFSLTILHGNRSRTVNVARLVRQPLAVLVIERHPLDAFHTADFHQPQLNCRETTLEQLIGEAVMISAHQRIEHEADHVPAALVLMQLYGNTNSKK